MGPVWYHPIIFSRAVKVSRTLARTIHFLEHLKHTLDVVMVQEPRARIALILLKWYSKTVCHIDRLTMILTEQHAYDTLAFAYRCPRRMISHGEQHQGVHHHRRRRRKLTHLRQRAFSLVHTSEVAGIVVAVER